MWQTVPNFENYEYNSMHEVRNKKTGQMCSRLPVSFSEYGFVLKDENGKAHKIKESVLFDERVDLEEWFTLDEYDKYEITKSGKVRNAKTKNILSPVATRFGYLALSLRDNYGKTHRVMIHRLIATQFLDNPDNLPIVNHIDENKTNNNVSNLEWVSAKENSNHGTSPHRIRKALMKPINEYDKQGQYIRTWNSAKSISEWYKMSASEVRYSINNNWFCKGHIFRDYEGNIDNLVKSQIPKTKRKPKESDITKLPVPKKYLYVEVEESVDDIFKKYKTASTITNTQRLKDFEKVFGYIARLGEDHRNG
ncbi:MAG: HNH endonuclease [Lachnospiraceae bacterium]|nr:HNH endonuclease [Lachnospiraceae bacterium]